MKTFYTSPAPRHINHGARAPLARVARRLARVACDAARRLLPPPPDPPPALCGGLVHLLHPVQHVCQRHRDRRADADPRFYDVDHPADARRALFVHGHAMEHLARAPDHAREPGAGAVPVLLPLAGADRRARGRAVPHAADQHLDRRPVLAVHDLLHWRDSRDARPALRAHRLLRPGDLLHCHRRQPQDSRPVVDSVGAQEGHPPAAALNAFFIHKYANGRNDRVRGLQRAGHPPPPARPALRQGGARVAQPRKARVCARCFRDDDGVDIRAPTSWRFFCTRICIHRFHAVLVYVSGCMAHDGTYAFLLQGHTLRPRGPAWMPVCFCLAVVMHAPPPARTSAVGFGRSARRLAQRHAADAAQAALALAAVALAAVLASYLLWAWRDIDFACAARHSEHCTAPVADPAMRAIRDQLCRMRASDCAHNFASLALRPLADDALDAVAAAMRHVWARLRDTFLAVLVVLCLVWAVRKIFELAGARTVLSWIQAISIPGASAPASAEWSSAGGAPSTGRQ